MAYNNNGGYGGGGYGQSNPYDNRGGYNNQGGYDNRNGGYGNQGGGYNNQGAGYNNQQNGGYGGQSNPYDNRGGYDNRPYDRPPPQQRPPQQQQQRPPPQQRPAPQQQPYGSSQQPPYSQEQKYPQQSQYERQPSNQYSGQDHGDVEMQPLTGQTNAYDANVPPQRDPNAILNDCRAVGRAIDDLEARLTDLNRLQRGFVGGSGVSNREIDSLSADIMSGYRGLGDRVKRIKSSPDAGLPRNKPQVEALDRRIRKAIQHFQTQESSFRKEVTEQQRRQYLIVRPDATESEIREATESGGDTQIFQQALLQSDRRGQAQSTLRNVQQRHEAIQQIEKTMIELQQLFQDLDAIVVQQDAPIMAIEQKAEETNTHLEAGNVEVAKAVNSARAARKKKWICLGICVAIIIIIIAIIVIYGATQGWFAHKSTNNNGSSN